MKAATKAFLIMLVIIFYFMSCKKVERDPEMKTSEQTHSNLTAQARAFFDKEFATKVSFQDRPENKGNKRKDIQKTPDWDKSYISKTTKREIVIVPLKFSSEIHTSEQAKGAKKLNLEHFTNLYIYKGEDGVFRAEVVYKIPNKKYLSTLGDKYSGEMIIEDWSGNAVASYHIDEGKYFKLTSKEDQARMEPTYENVVCVYLDHWNCKKDEYNSLYDCQLMYSEFLGCYGGPKEGGGDPYGEPETCHMVSPHEVLAASDPVSEPESGYAGPELFNVQGDRTRTVYFNWRFHRGNVGFLNWWLISHDSGTQIFAAGDTDWKWKTLQHNSESATGFLPLGTFMYVDNVIAEITDEGTRANIQIKYRIKNCKICPGIFNQDCSTESYTSSTNRGVHQL